MRLNEKQQVMFAMVEEYETGDESLKGLAARHGIPTHQLVYWRRKYLRHAQDTNSGFVRIAAPLLAGTTLRYPNGVELSLPATASTALLRELICLYPA
jgi:transposase-like protein